MRGIVFGDLEKSFDPAVGVVVDGIALVTNTSALIDTFDLEYAEILRGPQGTLFGRNTIAGVVNLRRSRPTGELGGKFQFRYGSHNETDLKGVFNFPVTDTIAVKVAAFMDKGDGFQEEADFNLQTGEITGTGDDIDGEDTFNTYASVLWTPTDSFDALLTFEYGNDDSTLSTPTNLTTPNIEALWGPISQAMFAAIGAGTDPGQAIGTAVGTALFFGGNFCDVYGAALGPVQGIVPDVACASQGYLIGEENDYKYAYSAIPFKNEIEHKAVTLEFNWDVGDYTITSVSGWRDSNEILDEDNIGAPIPIFNPIRPQDYEQWSTELRVVSELAGPLNFQAGAYYVNSEYEINATLFAIDFSAPASIADAGQELNAFALFGEAYFDINDRTRLTAGGRWTTEEKEFWLYQAFGVDPSGQLPFTWGCGNLNSEQQATADAVAAAHIASAPDEVTAAARAEALTCNDDNGKDSWSEFTPRVSLDYRFTDDVMGYVSWSRGFRSGGWNGRATTPSSIGPYDPETVDSYEVGVRSQLFDQRLQLNATYFHSKYKDKHESVISAFGVSTITIVENAAEASIDGIELEWRLVPNDRLQVRGSVGWTSGEYDEFIGFNRLTGRVEDISDSFDFGFQPEWNISVGADYFVPLQSDLGSLLFAANYSWFDETVGNFGQPDPQGLGRNVFPSRGLFDFSVTWDNRWLKVAGFVKDAFHDGNYLATSVDVGVFWFGAVAQGRSWGIELTKEF
jgi:iron complex outermembrane receptor protein